MLRDVVLTQQREIERQLREPYVERGGARERLSTELAAVVLGPRRAGKSSLAMHAAARRGRFGYVNFDDERLLAVGDFDALLAAVDDVYGSPRDLLLDEVQNVQGWELIVNRLGRAGRRLLITGSNAHLLGTELATHLTGRHLAVVLLPFSFAEVLRASGEVRTSAEKAEALRAYAETGGYPEPLLKPIDRREYLTTLLRSTLHKDIAVRHRIRAPQALEDLARYLMSNVAQEYSLHRLVEGTRLRSVQTVERYLRFLEEAFLLFSVRRFSFKVREQARANRKAYCIDNGLVTSTSFRFSAGRGPLYENLAAIELHRRELAGELELFYWKGTRQEEVDFVVKRGPRVEQLIQVCVSPEEPRTRQREVRALLHASRELGCDDLLVLTDAMEGQETASWFGMTGTIRFVPLWSWLEAQEQAIP